MCSVLVKDMKMPDKCGQCPCFHYEYPMYCQATKEINNKIPGAPYEMPRPDWCPLVLPSVQPEPCSDAISREAVSAWLKQYGQDVLHGKYKFSLMYIWKNIMELPSVQPVDKDINVSCKDAISRQAVIDTLCDWICGVGERCVKTHCQCIRRIEAIPSVDVPDTNVGDLISRQDAIDAVDKLSDKPIGYLEYAIDVLVDLPSVQPDIIVCADCKHWVCHDKRCGYWNHGVQPMMWCSQAERRWKE